jgi:3-methyladenine DNA glycosylase/8-oxoguanine DNA glycosylase
VAVPTEPSLDRVWRPAWPCPVPLVLGALRRGGGDPSFRRDAAGTTWKSFRAPTGPVTLAVRPLDSHGEVRSRAWGAGAEWVLDRLPALLGVEDDPSGFRPLHEVLVEPSRRYEHWRACRTGLVMESLVPAVLEQKVTGKEAFASWRRLLQVYGEPAPGPVASTGMRVMPSVGQLRAVPSWGWVRLGVDHKRAATIAVVLRHATALERLVDVSHAEADRRLRSLPGVGVWTSAEVRSRALGDADAVSFGDYHVAKDVGYALTGRPVDDETMAVLLEPYRPHRLRVQVLVGLGGLRRPRRGPRMTLPTHLPTG